MTINIIQTITNILTENGELISSKKAEGYIITPAEGKLLLNKATGETFGYKIYTYHKSAINDYIEIEPKKEEN